MMRRGALFLRLAASRPQHRVSSCHGTKVVRNLCPPQRRSESTTSGPKSAERKKIRFPSLNRESAGGISRTAANLRGVITELQSHASRLAPRDVDEWRLLRADHPENLNAQLTNLLMRYRTAFIALCEALQVATGAHHHNAVSGLIKEGILPPHAARLYQPLEALHQDLADMQKAQPGGIEVAPQAGILHCVHCALLLDRRTRHYVLKGTGVEDDEVKQQGNELDWALRLIQQVVLDFPETVDDELRRVEGGPPIGSTILEEISTVSTAVERSMELLEWEHPGADWPDELTQESEGVLSEVRSMVSKMCEVPYQGLCDEFVVHTPHFANVWMSYMQARLMRWSLMVGMFRRTLSVDVAAVDQQVQQVLTIMAQQAEQQRQEQEAERAQQQANQQEEQKGQSQGQGKNSGTPAGESTGASSNRPAESEEENLMAKYSKQMQDKKTQQR